VARIKVDNLQGIKDICEVVQAQAIGRSDISTQSVMVRRWEISALVANCFESMLEAQLPIYRDLLAQKKIAITIKAS
jgi:hypothetical protein